MPRDDDASYHGFCEQRDFHSTDRKLRSIGFVIHSRAKNQTPIWKRDGHIYTQKEAEKILKATLPVPLSKK